MVKRLYIDTSVFGGYFDEEFEAATRFFFDRIIKNQVQIVVSDILELEIYEAPNHIIEFYESLPDDLIERVKLTEDVLNLSEKYIIEKVVGRINRADCQHIAIATVNNVEALISWNYKHIVNLEKIRGYNAINLKAGYQMLEIRTPNEVFNYEEGQS